MSVRWTRRRTHLLVAFLLSVTLYIFCGSLTPTLPSPRPRASTDLPPARSSVSSHGTSVPKPPTLTPTKYGDGAVEMVVASMKRENITWLHNYLLDWKKNIYVVDDSTAELTVPQNKGREAMVFLTYIINRYDSLPGNIFFHHAERFQWHNDNPDYDALTLLQRFRLQYLKEQGYANLRCDWALGCPSAIKPFVDKTEPEPGEGITAKHVYKESFEELFPGKEVPQTVAVPCCSQFAVRRETVRKRPKADYIRYRQWLIESDLDDGLSGRVLEYAWHSELS
ncbi:hypothetical protein FQN49_002735 [Arthroderma sp. PD_2]|nr:hypothetical protein FQN49_002735 [Arthroderma sp. PD_2]